MRHRLGGRANFFACLDLRARMGATERAALMSLRAGVGVQYRAITFVHANAGLRRSGSLPLLQPRHQSRIAVLDISACTELQQRVCGVLRRNGTRARA